VFRAADGTTVDVITVSDATDTERMAYPDGQYLHARWPNGRNRSTTDNARGWYRTPGELAAAGVDVGSLVEVCTHCRQALPADGERLAA
jgi:hypothetical protein